MHYFLPPKNLLEKYSFLKFSGGKKWNIGVIWVNYALTPVKSEQKMPKLTDYFWVLRRRKLIKRNFSFTPENCVRCEAIFVSLTRCFARHCPKSGANIQACIFSERV